MAGVAHRVEAGSVLDRLARYDPKMDPASLAAPSEFWATVAQVIPVLALALVLESRVLARRWGKKRAFEQRKERRMWAVAAIIVTILMVMVEANALGQLWKPTSTPFLDVFGILTAQLVIAATLLLVVSIPIMSIAVPAVLDALGVPLLRRLLRKRRREAIRERKNVALIALESESGNLDALLVLAEWRRVRIRFDAASEEMQAKFLSQNRMTGAEFDVVEEDYEKAKKSLVRLRGLIEEIRTVCDEYEARSLDDKTSLNTLRKLDKRNRKALQALAG